MSESGSDGSVWWVVVTGASQGLGAAICKCLAPLLAPGSKLVGIARSREGLQATAASVKEANPNVTLVPVVMDLSTANACDMEAALSQHLQESQAPLPTQALFFHNAGSLGTVKYLREVDDRNALDSYFKLNISSVAMLNGIFLKMVSKLSGTVVKVINMSSLCAVEPFKSWGLYCSAKAARNMMFKVLAAEEPDIRVLNYAPGPVATNMQVLARTETQDSGLREIFKSMKDEGKLLSTEQSIKKLLQVLEKDEYKSGDHVDYFDVQ